MKNFHISELVLQEFVLTNTGTDEIKNHLRQCEQCRARANAYRSVFKVIEKSAKPEFDFDLSELVIAKIEKSKIRLSMSVLMLLLFAGLFVVCILAYIFNQNTISWVIGLQKMALYLLVVTGFIPFAFLAIEIYNDYSKKIQALNFLN